ncbi:hypothetical protein ACIREO_22125, partial [Streptomyces sp. NPDC102441]
MPSVAVRRRRSAVVPVVPVPAPPVRSAAGPPGPPVRPVRLAGEVLRRWPLRGARSRAAGMGRAPAHARGRRVLSPGRRPRPEARAGRGTGTGCGDEQRAAVL